MGKIDSLLEQLNTKLKKDSEEIKNRVYEDEPILITASQMKSYTPKKYREMRQMASGGGIYYEPSARIFYEQGKFMEDFEDDYEYKGAFATYFPTYQSMNDLQLRGYFSWRTKLRHGVITKTSTSFAFVYVYELLNLIGADTPELAFEELKGFWKIYRDMDFSIDRYMRMWLKDFVIYYNLDRELLGEITDVSFDEQLAALQNYQDYGSEEFFHIINRLSSYDMEKSRLYKKYPKEVMELVYRVYSEMSEYYAKKNKVNMCEKFFGKKMTERYTVFRSAVFYHREKHEDGFYEVNKNYRYICENGSWSCERFFWQGGKNKKIGAFLKNIDYRLRLALDLKPYLKEVKSTKLAAGIIDREIGEMQAEKNAAAAPKIEIDISKLSGIREMALETQSRLTVDDPGDRVFENPYKPELACHEADDMKIAGNIFAGNVPGDAYDMGDTETGGQAESPENEAGRDSSLLDNNQRRLLICLLNNQPYDSFIREAGVMLSVLVDSINESLFDEIGDTVIEYQNERPSLIEDYTGELKGIFGI